MKKNFKKTISLVLTALILMTCWVFVAPESAQAEDGRVTPWAWAAINGDDQSRGTSSLITICSDGYVANTTVGEMRFDISSVSQSVSQATLTINAGMHSGAAVPSNADVYMIDPSKCLVTNSYTYQIRNISSVYNNTYTSASYALNNYYKVSDADLIGSIKQEGTRNVTFDATNAVNKAKSNGWSELCLLFIMPQAYSDGGNPNWSDIIIYPSGTSLTYTAAAADASQVAVNMNTAEVNSISGLNTDVTTVHGSFPRDDSYVTSDYYSQIYKNVLYSGTVQYDANGSYADAYIWNIDMKDRDCGGLAWYYPETTFLYDGETTPTTAIMFNYDAYGSCKLRVYSAYLIDTSNLKLMRTYWNGQEGTVPNFMYYYFNFNNNCATTDASVNGTYCWTHQKGDQNWFLTNILGFKGTMDDNTYVRVITPSFGFKGNQASQGTGNVYTFENFTVSTKLYAVNYVPLKNAIKQAVTAYNNVKANPGAYTTESVAKFTKLAKALVAAKPNNFVNATTNNYNGYAAAAKAAVDAWNAWSGLEYRTFDVSYENLFSLSSWINSASAAIGKGTLSYDASAGSITIADTAGDGATDTSTAYSVANMYGVKVKANTEYVFEYDVDTTGTNTARALVFDSNSTVSSYDYVLADKRSSSGNQQVVFTSPNNDVDADGYTYIHFRFGTMGDGPVAKFSNITLYEKERADELDFASWSTRPLRKVYTYNQVMGNLDTPVRRGYVFNSWFVDYDGNGEMAAQGEQITTDKISSLVLQDWALLSDWSEGSYNIAFIANHGSGTMSTVSGVMYETETALKENAFTRAGHTFTGWNTEADGSGTAYSDKQSVKRLGDANETVTLYAQWEANDYTVKFVNAKNQTLSETVYKYGTLAADITVPANSALTYDETNHYTYTWPAIGNVAGDVTYTEITNTAEHNYGQWQEIQKPTCDLEGEKQRTCETCGYVETASVELAEHKLVNVPAVPATCTQDGTIEYWYCSECQKKFGDADAINEITDIIDAADGHTEKEIPEVEATCKDTGLAAGVYCSVCNEILVEQQETPKKDHTKEIIPAVEATCTADGKTEGLRCSVCKEILKEQETVPSPGHDWSETYISNGHGINATHYQTCGTCGEESERVTHTWNDGEVEKAATCTVDGQMLYTCTANGCGGQYIGKIAAPGHNYGEWIAEEEATCLEGGVRGHYQCSECKKYFDEDKNEITDLVIGALNHDIKKHSAKAATCTEDGWEAYETCSRCDYTTYKAIGSLGHDEVPHEAKAPSCTKIGWDAYVTCSRCDYTTYEEKTALGHDKINHKAQAPTCTEGGWEAYETCSRCDYTTYKAIGKLGHIEIKHEAKTPTCTEIGWDAYVTCDREGCNYTTYKEKDSLGHNIVVDKAVAPTCTDTGLTEGSHCTRCNDATVAQTVVPELGHAYVDHDAEAPTCTEIGWDAYQTCSRCDYTTYAEKPASGHAYVDHEAKAPDCTNIGWDAYQTCENCDYTTYVEKEALDHDYIDHEGQDATCLVDGWKAYQTCSRCDYTTYEAITAQGHSIVKVDAQAPDCEEIGWDAYEYCTECDYTTYVEIPENGHSIIKVGAKEPNCTEIGWDAYEYCTECDYTTYNELPTNGGHDLIDVEAKAVTCTEDGWDAYEYCSKCDYTTYEVITASGHAYVDHEGKAPTCTEDGWEAYKTCEKCDYTSYKAIGAFGHSVVNVPAQAPTCEDIGWDAYERCLRCDYTTYVEIPSNGHSIKQYDAQAPACEEAGWEAYEACENCDYTTKVEISATGHSIKQYGAQAPTCAAAGHDAYEACDNCDYTTKVEIPALEHAYVNHDGKDATCSAEGWKPYQTCENCDYSSYEAIPEIDHNIIKHDAKAPTCKEIGWEAYETCAMCDYSTYKELPAVDHADENKDGICDDCSANIGCKHAKVITTVVESTCLTYGKVTETCSECGTFISEELIAPTGHKDKNGDGECDDCSAPVAVSTSCDCICHKSSGIMRFIYSILRTFWRLFKITKTCPCGAVHY